MIWLQPNALEQAKQDEQKIWQEVNKNPYPNSTLKKRLEHQSQQGIRIYHYHTDHLGTPQELTNDRGDVVWLNYSLAWGGSFDKLNNVDNLDGLDVSADELQPIRFQGQSLDVETGLHYNRFRYYDSDVGMFVSRDPIGLLGGDNVFQYGLNPIGWIDVFGLRGAYMFETKNGTCYVGKGAWGRYTKSTRQRSRADGSKTSKNSYDDAVPKGTHITVKSPCSQVNVDDYAEMVEHTAMLLLEDNVKNKLYKGCANGFANGIASPGAKKLEAQSSVCPGLKLSATTDATRLYNQFLISTSRR